MITPEEVKHWIDISAQLKELKAEEGTLRREIAAQILGKKQKGTKSGKIGIYSLKATAKVNQSLDKDQLAAVWDDLAPEEQASIKYTPSIIAKEYKKLPDDSMLNQVIEENPGMPGLELKGLPNLGTHK